MNLYQICNKVYLEMINTSNVADMTAPRYLHNMLNQ